MSLLDNIARKNAEIARINKEADRAEAQREVNLQELKRKVAALEKAGIVVKTPIDGTPANTQALMSELQVHIDSEKKRLTEELAFADDLIELYLAGDYLSMRKRLGLDDDTFEQPEVKPAVAEVKTAVAEEALEGTDVVYEDDEDHWGTIAQSPTPVVEEYEPVTQAANTIIADDDEDDFPIVKKEATPKSSPKKVILDLDDDDDDDWASDFNLQGSKFSPSN